MSRVKLGDVAFERKETCKNNRERYHIVGLEHLIPGQIILTEWGDDTETTFTRFFHKGDVLFGRRRAYLRKAAVAPFDGICSGDITVISTIDGKIDAELLPHIIQNEKFFDYAVGESAGSLSPRVKWEKLAQYEFELPSINEQKSLAGVLWSMVETQEAYKELLQKTDELVKSQFIEMFGSPVSLDKGWPIKTIGDVASSQLGKMLNAKNQTGKNPHYYLANRNVQWFKFDFTDFRQMDFDEKERSKFELQDDDLLVCEGGEIGRCAVWHKEFDDCYIQNAVHRVRCNKSIITPLFLGHVLYYHAQENGFADVVGVKVTIPHLPADKLKAMKIIVPPIEKQQEFEQLVHQSDKSKFALQKALEALNKTYKKIITENIG